MSGCSSCALELFMISPYFDRVRKISSATAFLDAAKPIKGSVKKALEKFLSCSARPETSFISLARMSNAMLELFMSLLIATYA